MKKITYQIMVKMNNQSYFDKATKRLNEKEIEDLKQILWSIYIAGTSCLNQKGIIRLSELETKLLLK